MKIYKPIGSKERFLEMFQGVNKVQINELSTNVMQTGTQLIEKAFEELKNKVAYIKQTNTQVVGEDNFVEIITNDNEGNEITFTFKVNSNESDQDGVYNVNDAVLTKFKVVSERFNVDWDENMKFLQEFNANHSAEIMDVISNYANFETDTSSIDDEVYEEAIKLIDKVPYKKGTETMQTNKAYADQKPTNPDVRVHATELDKFVSEMEDYVNSAEEEDEFALPDEHDATELPNDDNSRGIDPYDQEIADAEAGKNDWEISGRKPEKPKYHPPYMEKTGNRERAVPTWAEDLLEDDVVEATDQDRYEDVVFLQGEEADEPLEILRNQGEDAAMNYLKQWHDIGNHMGKSEKGAGSSDRTYEKDGYIMSWNFPLNYIGLEYDLSMMNEDTEKTEYPDQIGKKFKPKNQFPKKKKKPQSVVKLSEESEIPQEYWGNPEDEINEEDTVDVEVNNELEGGLADDKTPADFDPKQLAMGLEVEMEHTDDPKVALEIAMDHLMEIPDYYTRLDKMEQEAGSEEPKQDTEGIETDELLGYKPHNVNDYANEEFNFASAEREYHDKENYDVNVDNKDNDIPENFWQEYQSLIDEYGERVVNYLFNNGLRGYYETVAKGNYTIDDVKKTLEMLKIDTMNEINIVDDNENQTDVGDRYRDAEGNQLTVRNKEQDTVGLQSQEGDKEIASQDLQFLKKLSESVETAKRVLKNREFNTGMTKKEAVQILIKHNIK